ARDVQGSVAAGTRPSLISDFRFLISAVITASHLGKAEFRSQKSVFIRADIVKKFFEQTGGRNMNGCCARASWFGAGVLATLLGGGVGNGGETARTREALAEPATASLQKNGFWRPTPAEVPKDGKLRIIAFGAHPDDCELKAAG